MGSLSCKMISCDAAVGMNRVQRLWVSRFGIGVGEVDAGAVMNLTVPLKKSNALKICGACWSGGLP